MTDLRTRGSNVCDDSAVPVSRPGRNPVATIQPHLSLIGQNEIGNYRLGSATHLAIVLDELLGPIAHGSAYLHLTQLFEGEANWPFATRLLYRTAFDSRNICIASFHILKTNLEKHTAVILV